MESKDRKTTVDPVTMIPLGMCIGAGVGVALGLVMGNLAVGIVIGAGSGVAIGAGMMQAKRKSDKK